jgi:hypothetical protein
MLLFDYAVAPLLSALQQTLIGDTYENALF